MESVALSFYILPFSDPILNRARFQFIFQSFPYIFENNTDARKITLQFFPHPSINCQRLEISFVPRETKGILFVEIAYAIPPLDSGCFWRKRETIHLGAIVVLDLEAARVTPAAWNRVYEVADQGFRNS